MASSYKRTDIASGIPFKSKLLKQTMEVICFIINYLDPSVWSALRVQVTMPNISESIMQSTPCMYHVRSKLKCIMRRMALVCDRNSGCYCKVQLVTQVCDSSRGVCANAQYIVFFTSAPTTSAPRLHPRYRLPLKINKERNARKQRRC